MLCLVAITLSNQPIYLEAGGVIIDFHENFKAMIKNAESYRAVIGYLPTLFKAKVPWIIALKVQWVLLALCLLTGLL